MSLEPGQALSHYRLVEQIGEGGMGVVWKAADTKLGREVAIKVLPAELAADPDRLARFEREAKLLASLNHPNIAAIHEFDEAGGVQFLALELVEGEDLATRIARGPVSPEEAIDLSRQIATALEAAHEVGIIHRDLKPANVKVRRDGTVKVLDFGLAKALETAPSGASPALITESPTITARATALGVVLGTAAYMAPEQAKGQTLDRRADVWAFGVVLYEMLTGHRPFGGDSVTEVMAAVIRDTPDLDALPAATPLALRRLLRRCLAKEPRKRLRDMGDVGVELDEALNPEDSDPSETAVAHAVAAFRPSPFALIAGAVALTALASITTWSLKPESVVVDEPVIRFSLLIGHRQDVNLGFPCLALSQDGRRLAYRARDIVFIRDLDEPDARELVRSEGSGVWLSPDGESVLYGTPAGLSRIPVAGGRPLEVAASDQLIGADWGDDGTIVFSDSRKVFRVSDVGGTPQVMVESPADSDRYVAWPQLLQGGSALLYTAYEDGSLSTVVRSLKGGTERTVLEGFGGVRHSPTGHLLYGLEDRLFLVPFDLDGHQVTGTATSVPESVFVSNQTSWMQAAVSRNGTLAYIRSRGAAEDLRLVWADEKGNTSPVVTDPHSYSDLVLSPDSRRAAVHWFDEDNDIWVIDLVRGGLTRITFTPTEDETPVWSPDGRELAYATMGGAEQRILFRKPADGGAAAVEREVWRSPDHFHANDWSPDGRTILVEVRRPETRNDIVAIDAETGAETVLLASSYSEAQARFSPDGKWLAYSSDESGRREVYVQSYPALDVRVAVSTEGGSEPIWSADGRRLFYRSSQDIMAVRVSSTSPLEFGNPEKLFADRFVRTQGDNHTHYDVAGDGRFLLIDGPPGAAASSPIEVEVVLNWTAELKRNLPAD